VRRFGVASALALVVAACGKTEGAPPALDPPVALVSDDHGGDAAVFLRGRADGDKVLVDVVARGAPDVHGAALRLRFDPAVLGFAGAEASGVWSKAALGIAKEGTPGQLAIAWTEKGEIGIEANAEATLGTLTFKRRKPSSTTIAFRPERSALVDRHGNPLPMSFRGGTLPAL
jgi:hypothetical protein